MRIAKKKKENYHKKLTTLDNNLNNTIFLCIINK